MIGSIGRRRWLAYGACSLSLGVVMLAASACGDVYADPEGPEQPTARPATDSGFGSTVFPSEVRGECPASRPRENTGCGVAGTTCEYGKSADSQCNSTLACFGDSFRTYWDARPTDRCHAKTCPATPVDVSTLEGKPCGLAVDGAAAGEIDPDGGATTKPITDADEAVCNMANGICACTTGASGTAHARVWVCMKPLAVCPPNRPLAGTVCSGALYCDYGSCAFKRGVVMECQNDHWQVSGATCP